MLSRSHGTVLPVRIRLNCVHLGATVLALGFRSGSVIEEPEVWIVEQSLCHADLQTECSSRQPGRRGPWGIRRGATWCFTVCENWPARAVCTGPPRSSYFLYWPPRCRDLFGQKLRFIATERGSLEGALSPDAERQKLSGHVSAKLPCGPKSLALAGTSALSPNTMTGWYLCAFYILARTSGTVGSILNFG